MGEFSLMHWLVIGVILLLFFGPNKVESIGKSLAKGIRGFKEGLNEINAEARELPPKKENQAQVTHDQQSASEPSQADKSHSETSANKKS